MDSWQEEVCFYEARKFGITEDNEEGGDKNTGNNNNNNYCLDPLACK